MDSNKIVLFLIAIGLALGAFFIFNNDATPNEENTTVTVIETEETPEVMEETDDVYSVYTDRVRQYSQEEFEKVISENKKPVIFFRADWCPTCRAADKDFEANPESIPSEVVILKADYDTETELKRKYNVTIQHTFVQIDETQAEVTTWIGGSIKEIEDNLL